MTTVNMKSEVNTMNSKVQCEARILPKRRVSKTPSHLLENGGFNEADLTLAIQESLKSARKSQKRESEIKENSVSCHSTSENNQTRMAGKLSNNDCSQQEIKHLKELLLLHLEMIRHQEQLLVAKDQEIKTLQSEKEALHCRLDRMDRRMSLLKQKDEPFETSIVKENVNESPPTLTSEKPHKRKIPTDSHSSRKRIHSSSDTPRERTNKQTKLVFDRAPDRLPAGGVAENIRSRNSSAESVGRNYSSEPGDRNVSEPGAGEMETLLKTDSLYHIMCCEPHSFRISNISLSEAETKAQAQGIVETPSWRYVTYTNLYQMEGTENIEDETIFKRHQKPEMEERKRKRWDLQRLREQRALEKLQERYRQNHRSVDEGPSGRKRDSNEGEVDTLHPCLEDITHLEVSDRLTVNAFGQPLPYMKQTDFDLPWDSNEHGTSFRKSSSCRSLRR
ncbi:male-specific lethal 1-like 1 isoform X2 [Gigantopelta aegis]|uniref:male-specific lethal 1-like 1 isoform X2 n=1 Tax=Gigantopelta aegis TaxID=1735272 RepID=UPI001B88AE85|nr:male-specific lethal 1-like 1 isoform X2 [Gigantopelta aegis]